MQVERFELFREDIEDLVKLTVDKMAPCIACFKTRFCVLCTFLVLVAVLAGFSPGHVPLGLCGGSRFHHQHLHGGAHLGSLASLLHCHLLHDHRPAFLEDWKIGACTERRSDG